MATLLGCNTVEPVYRCSNCSEDNPNNILHVAYVKRGVTIPKTSVVASLLAAELAGNAYIIRNVSGEYDGGTYGDRTGRAKQSTQNGAGVFNVVYTDYTPIENSEFYDDMMQSGSNFYMIYFTEGIAHYAEAPLRVIKSDPITRDFATYQELLITVRWTKKNGPTKVSGIDDSLLEACPILFAFDEDNLFIQSGADGTLVGDTVTIDVNDNLDVRYDAFTALAYAELDSESDSLPDGVELSVSGNALIVSGTPTETGTFELTIICRNTTGVAGVVSITLVVV